jgi:hypothetical protein
MKLQMVYIALALCLSSSFCRVRAQCSQLIRMKKLGKRLVGDLTEERLRTRRMFGCVLDLNACGR